MEYSRSELVEDVHHNPEHEGVLEKALASCSFAVAVAAVAVAAVAVAAEAQG